MKKSSHRSRRITKIRKWIGRNDAVIDIGIMLQNRGRHVRSGNGDVSIGYSAFQRFVERRRVYHATQGRFLLQDQKIPDLQSIDF